MIGPYWNSWDGTGFLVPAAPILFGDPPAEELQQLPEETQLSLLQHGGDSPEELRRKLDELEERE
jgi:hypothetical protein